MITTYGKQTILNYFAGTNQSIGDSILLGVGNNLDGDNLGFEVARVPVNLVGLDYANNKVIFKGRVPLDLSSQITEVSLFVGEDFITEEDSNESLTPGGTGNIEWSILDTVTGQYIKEPSIRVNAKTFVDNISLDLSSFNDEDSIKILATSTTATTLTVQIGNNATNYYQYVFNVVSGKNIVKKVITDRTTVGTVDTENINYVSLQSPGTVILEGMRFENKFVDNINYGVVAYQVLDTALIKGTGEEKEVEYALTIGIN